MLLLTLLLVLPPVVLVRVVGWPVQGWPDVRQWVAQPLTEQTLIVALTVLGWLVWLLLAVTVTVRAAVRVRAGARWLRAMPLPTPLQATATGMAGAAAFGAGAHTGATGTAAEPALPVAAGTLDHAAVEAAEHQGACRTSVRRVGWWCPGAGCLGRSPSRSPQRPGWRGCAADAATNPGHHTEHATMWTWRRCPRPSPPSRPPSPHHPSTLRQHRVRP